MCRDVAEVPPSRVWVHVAQTALEPSLIQMERWALQSGKQRRGIGRGRLEGGRDIGLYTEARQEVITLTLKALGKVPQLRPVWAPPRPSEVAGGDPPGSHLSERGPLSPETRPIPKQPGSRLIHPTCEHVHANTEGECKPTHQPHQEMLQSE